MNEETLITGIEFPEFYNKHYILLDSLNNIIDGWSNGPHPNKDISNAICINEEGSYHFTLNGIENPSLFDEDGISLYKYENDKIISLTQIEKNIYRAIKENKQLPTIKQQLIADSKKQLEEYLANNPLIWTDKKAYSVTQEKQTLLTQQLALYAMDEDTKLYWNASGEECKVWPIAALASLAKAIADYVRPYVRYQQQKESEINAAETADEARSITIDYSTLS